MKVSPADLAIVKRNTPNPLILTLKITNTISEDVNVEIFNNENSSIDIFDSGAQGVNKPYYPISTVDANAIGGIIVADPNTANGYFILDPMSGVDKFVNAGGTVPGNTTSTKNYLYFDKDGNLIYKQGYVNGAQDAGQCTVAATKTSYRNVFKTMGTESMVVDFMRVTTLPAYSMQLQQSLYHVQSNIIAGVTQSLIDPAASQTENALNPNIITFPTNNMVISPRGGVRYNLLAGSVGTPNVIIFQVFFRPARPTMLAMYDNN